MCGVIGISMKDANLNVIRNLFKQSMIRGKHATGITYVYDGELKTHKESIPADVFLDKFDFEQIVDKDGSVSCIGHIRYSTSTLEYNQPFFNKEISVVHNGVISQEDPSTWSYKTETPNDSELILRAREHKETPLTKFRPSSMAVVELLKDKTIVAYRNEARPLWYTELNNGIVFTSTKDIAYRSNLTSSKKCGMFVEYQYNNKLEKISIDVPEGVQDLQC